MVYIVGLIPIIITIVFYIVNKNCFKMKNVILKFFLILFLLYFISALSLFFIFRDVMFDFYRFLLLLSNAFIFLFSISFISYCVSVFRNKEIVFFCKIWYTSVINWHFCKKNDELNFFHRVIWALIPLSGIIYMIFCFGIIETYTANIQEWKFGLNQLFLPMIIVSLISIFISSFIISIFKADDYKRAIIVISSLFIFFYIQNAFMNSRKLLIGSEEHAELYVLLLNTFLLLIMIIIPIIFYQRIISKRKKIFYFFIVLSAFLFIIQLAPLPFLIKDYKAKSSDADVISNQKVEDYRFSGEEQFKVGSNNNVIVFILDTYDSESFENYLKENPERFEIFKDFTYFDNISTNGVNTIVSMPYLLTAGDFDSNISISDSNKKAWEGENADYFYSTVHDMGYSVHLYSDSDLYLGDAINMMGKIDNIEKFEFDVITNKWKTFFSFSRLSLFKYSPFAFKDFFHISDSDEINQFSVYYYKDHLIDNNDVNSNDTSKAYGIDSYNFDFIKDEKKGLECLEGNYIIFQHLFGMHVPYYSINSKDELVNSYEEQKICMELLDEYINQLKQMELYNNSTIIITADHGIPMFFSDASEPLMLIKRSNNTGTKMQTNSCPGVLQYDLLPTILDCIGADSSKIKKGKSLFLIDESDNRERYIFVPAYNFKYPSIPKARGFGDACFNVIEEYRFSGKVSEIDLEKDLYSINPMYDYWW